jgi:beta-ureidopropionase / N-carbamoyl-L-amino-acid hydrolase
MKRHILLALLMVCTAALAQKNKKKAELPRVNQARIEERIFALAKYGMEANGETQRVAFTQADIDGRNYFIGLMKQAGLEVSIDFAGNIIGKRAGKDPSKKPIVFGSHIDTVPHGGNYDGCYGSVSALEVIDVLNENKIITSHPLEVIIFSNEEGGVVGSSAIAGQLRMEALDEKTNSGLTMREGINAIGGNADRLGEVKRNKGDIKYFLELHIEQGGTLEREKIQIGVVEGIVGLNWWEVTVDGFANHAGTTPMNMRKDALLTASKLVVDINETVNSFEGRHVGTVGKLSVSPGAPNVIPGKVVFTLELRDLSAAKIQQVFTAIEGKAKALAQETGNTITIKPLSIASKPAMADPFIQQTIVASAKDLGYTHLFLPSGAGHDAQEMALLAPMGMIFIPSAGGISHSPKEFSTAVDMANGANVLLRTILKLDLQ